MNLRISKNGLDIIKSLIVDLDVEACGFLLEEANRTTDGLSVYIDSYGTSENGRVTCKQRKYTKYIWHTHTMTSIAYPSPEDILKIIKKRNSENPQVSVVFTKWGIWYLYSERKVNLDENWIAYFTEKINKVSKILYERTEKGRGRFQNEDITGFIDSVQEIINRKLNAGFQTKFEVW